MLVTCARACLTQRNRAWLSTATSKPVVGLQYTLQKAFTVQEVQQFLEATGDHNPIHLHASAAKQTGFPGPILPGILLASLFPAVIGTNFPGAVYATQSLAFKAPALVGQPVKAVVTVIRVSGSKVSFDTRCYTDDTGTAPTVLVEGAALAILR